MKNLSIIVPFRNREEHLNQFLPHMENSVLLNEINFEILIVEQEEGKPFNRGKLLNVGAKESEFASYFCFHDVDMLPISSDYSPIEFPTHLAAEAEQFGYRLPYDKYFGGVTLFDKNSFYKINGFSNDYWGWGAEDDDIMFRCEVNGVKTHRKNGRYKSLSHEREIIHSLYNENLKKYYGFKNSQSSQEIEDLINSDGLGSLEYEILSDERISDKCRKIKVKI
jgi:glycosyltransferase involved in cell wall biosynthesis